MLSSSETGVACNDRQALQFPDNGPSTQPSRQVGKTTIARQIQEAIGLPAYANLNLQAGRGGFLPPGKGAWMEKLQRPAADGVHG